MLRETKELEHIGLRMIDDMPIGCWRGVEDAIDLVPNLVSSSSRSGEKLSVKVLIRKLES